MKEVLASVNEASNHLECRVRELTVNEEGIRFQAVITSVQPQRIVFISFLVFNEEQWVYNPQTEKFKTFGFEPQFKVESIDYVKLYPTQTLNIEGITDQELKEFCQTVNPDMCKMIFEHTEM
ncbi:hypothetical protein COL23_25760 [Priestia aryabhattai]|uniref:hypothetical protein n=1 Tax=Priestia aryabhattai TaxID=412384 RepID=UPI000BF7B0B0|nr:hypothetical protein [Priestia aryabhattai]PFW72160.1 hypothetical protein COL23_25760 [Priestia aryabhattai]